MKKDICTSPTRSRRPSGGFRPAAERRRSGSSAFGPNGLRFDKHSHHVYFNVTSDHTGAGIVYTLPAVPQPQAADLQVFHTYAGEGPDDLAFGRSGRLYVSLAFANAISVLDESGAEIARYGGTTASGVPVDGPANMAFDDSTRSLVFANHAPVSGNPNDFALDEPTPSALALLAARVGLTPAETRTLSVLALGESNRQIARRLGVSIETVRTHVRRVLAKLSVRSRAEAARLARAE